MIAYDVINFMMWLTESQIYIYHKTPVYKKSNSHTCKPGKY